MSTLVPQCARIIVPDIVRGHAHQDVLEVAPITVMEDVVVDVIGLARLIAAIPVQHLANMLLDINHWANWRFWTIHTPKCPWWPNPFIIF